MSGAGFETPRAPLLTYVTYREIGKSPGAEAVHDSVAEVGLSVVTVRSEGGDGGTDGTVVTVPRADGAERGVPSV
jgi:hypothetical protein